MAVVAAVALSMALLSVFYDSAVPLGRSADSSFSDNYNWILAQHRGVTCLCDKHVRQMIVQDKEGSCVLAAVQPTVRVAIISEEKPSKAPTVEVVVPDARTAAVVQQCLPLMHQASSKLIVRVDQNASAHSSSASAIQDDMETRRPLLVAFRESHRSFFHHIVGPDSAFQVAVTANVLANWYRPLSASRSSSVNTETGWINAWLSVPLRRVGYMKEFWTLALPDSVNLIASFTGRSNFASNQQFSRHRHVVLGIFKAHNLYWPFSWWPVVRIGDNALRHAGSATIDADFAAYAHAYDHKCRSKFGVDGSDVERRLGNENATRTAAPVVLIENRTLFEKAGWRTRGLSNELFEDLKAAVKFRKLRVYPQHIFENHVPLKHQFSAVRKSDLVIAAEGAFVTHQLWSRPGTTWAVVYKIELTRWWWEYRHYQYHTTVTRAVKGVKLIVFEVHPGHSPPALGELVVQAALAAHGSMQPGEVQLIVLGSAWTRLGVALFKAIAPSVNWLGGTTAGRLVLGGMLLVTVVVWCRRRNQIK